MTQEIIKRIATETFNKVSSGPSSSMEEVIDKFVVEYTKAILFEVTDVIRKEAAAQSPEVGRAMKVAVVDLLDHFGV